MGASERIESAIARSLARACSRPSPPKLAAALQVNGPSESARVRVRPRTRRGTKPFGRANAAGLLIADRFGVHFFLVGFHLLLGHLGLFDHFRFAGTATAANQRSEDEQEQETADKRFHGRVTLGAKIKTQ